MGPFPYRRFAWARLRPDSPAFCALVLVLAIVALGMLAACRAEAQVVVGAHLLSAHSRGSYLQTHPTVDPATMQPTGSVTLSHRYESRTFGLYARWPSGATAGVYRNSLGGTSGYLAWTWQTRDGHLALTAGAVTGYGPRLSPLLAPSVAAQWAGTTARLALIPKRPNSDDATALHLSVERAF